ncbi:SH3 domain-containing protein [Aurantimonas marianensis]|uniref:SH3 domain-containing protein n=1 Tax=Aurantimonas marianensis TaxID=2920428 RepID=A0A9X2H8K2_9HYPH|nr:SH3 domain-containing protein [Aurantimonas marianensis]MCP3055233.1 SH3 domain-containing protein [Aurantimonas marianensis]
MTRTTSAVAAATLALTGLGVTSQALAGDCTGRVTGVRPISSYDHQSGAGFLAVRREPSARARQIGEVYAGDLVSVYDRSGNWYHVTCMEGDCENPYWGPANPSGWVSARYVRARGVCP